MKTAKEFLMEKATQNNDGFLTGQVKWILEAMEEYGFQSFDKGYEKGYRDAENEAREEIHKNYHANTDEWSV